MSEPIKAWLSLSLADGRAFGINFDHVPLGVLNEGSFVNGYFVPEPEYQQWQQDKEKAAKWDAHRENEAILNELHHPIGWIK